jgi:hypothetical protein
LSLPWSFLPMEGMEHLSLPDVPVLSYTPAQLRYHEAAQALLANPPLEGVEDVRNRTLTLIEREDDTRSWENFLVYFSHSTTMPCPPRGWGYILIGC